MVTAESWALLMSPLGVTSPELARHVVVASIAFRIFVRLEFVVSSAEASQVIPVEAQVRSYMDRDDMINFLCERDIVLFHAVFTQGMFGYIGGA
jgi:hypothetical protein